MPNEELRRLKQQQRGKNLGPKIAAGAIAGTVIAGVLSSPKAKAKIKSTAKKAVSAVKNAFSKKEGTYTENPKTGKMERQKTVKPKKNVVKNNKKKI